MNFGNMTNINVGIYDDSDYNITIECIANSFELLMKAKCDQILRTYPALLLFPVSNVNQLSDNIYRD